MVGPLTDPDRADCTEDDADAAADPHASNCTGEGAAATWSFIASPEPPTEQSGLGIFGGMCRNIRTLYNFEPATTREEIHAAARQYVRKVSGMHKPSQANAAAFERAVDAIAHATEHLLDELVTVAKPRDREIDAARRRALAAARFGGGA